MGYAALARDVFTMDELRGLFPKDREDLLKI